MTDSTQNEETRERIKREIDRLENDRVHLFIQVAELDRHKNKLECDLWSMEKGYNVGDQIEYTPYRSSKYQPTKHDPSGKRIKAKIKEIVVEDKFVTVVVRHIKSALRGVQPTRILNQKELKSITHV